MTEKELMRRLAIIKERMFYRAENNSVYEYFFDQAKPIECNGKWYVTPVRFDDSFWNDGNYMSDLVRQMNRKFDRLGFSLRGEVLIVQAKHVCYLIIGREEILKFHASRDQEKVTVRLGQAERYTLPEFECGDPIGLKITSQQKGWLYLFCIDSAGVIEPVYPQKFGIKSDVKVSTNTSFDYSNEFANPYRKDQELDEWKFSGTTSGSERVFAMVVDTPKPVTISYEYILDKYSFPLLFAHREVSRGMEKISATDIEKVKASAVAIGFADYYYEG